MTNGTAIKLCILGFVALASLAVHQAMAAPASDVPVSSGPAQR